MVTGPTDGKSTTITSGLAAGDKVVIDGVDRLRDGAKVTVAAGQRPAEQASIEAPGRSPNGGAAACAAGLAPEAKTIYAAAAAEFASSTDQRAFMRAKVQDLVTAGTVQKDSARASAMAARDCLTQLSSSGTPDAQPGADAQKPADAGTPPKPPAPP